VDHENQILSELGLPTRMGLDEIGTTNWKRDAANKHIKRWEYSRLFSNGGSVSSWYDITP
jgi:hypothetical protein